MIGIFLSNSVSYDRVLTPISILPLKPLLGVIGAILLKPQVSPILYTYIRLVVTL